jgi:hypothetical protein
MYQIDFQPAVQRANAAHAARITAADAALAVANTSAATAFAAAEASDPKQANATYQAALTAASATRNETTRASFEQLRSDMRAIDSVLAVIGPTEGFADSDAPYSLVAGNANAAVAALVTKGFIVSSDVFQLRSV